MSKVVKINTDQTSYRRRLIDYDRIGSSRMPLTSPDMWDHSGSIGGKKYRVYASHGGTAPKSAPPARTSAVTAIACVDDDTVVIIGGQMAVTGITWARVVYACLAQALSLDDAYLGADARWLWSTRSQPHDEAAWVALVQVYEICCSKKI